MERLIVKYNQRKDVKNKGAVYVKGSFFDGTRNGFFVPEYEGSDITERQDCNRKKDLLLCEYGEEKAAKDKNNEKIWEEILRKRDTLDIAVAIRDIGLPPTELQRVEMLKVLRKPEKSLRIDWDALCKFSEDFNREYSTERVKNLAMKLKGCTDFVLGVESANITKEERELLYYVFPE